jgi:hypothetical protein
MFTYDFYAELPALDKFIDLANPDNYHDAPDDWYVLVSDITGSTKAIAAGRYKEVNLLGASSIIAVLNAINFRAIPFVFGGDGASLLVPPDCLQQGRTALIGVRNLARSGFGMELRVGAVPVETIKKKYPLKVAKFQLTSTYSQASFMGGGITYAADLLKANSLYQFAAVNDHIPANLEGLECRWQEVQNTQGQTLSLIIQAVASGGETNEAVYGEVLQEIAHIYRDVETYHPIATAALQLTFNPRKLFAEIKARAASNSLWHRFLYLLKILLENLLGVIFMKFGWKVGGVDWGKYRIEVQTASDYQKLDDMLRMVIASNPEHTQKLIEYLDKRSRNGQLVYGMHISDRALLTCLILDRRDQHFHLVDGANGGYTVAAEELKEKLRRKAQNWQSYAKLIKNRRPYPSKPENNDNT